MTESPLTLLAFALAAAVYAFVGHGGGSAYLALLGALGRPPAEMRTTALSLNMVVAGLAFLTFRSRARLRADLLLHTAVGGVPAAFLGAKLGAPAPIFWALVGLALLGAAARMIFPEVLRRTRLPEPAAAHARTRTGLVFAGIALGFVAGLCGIGGGVFLSPWLLVIGACSAVECAGIAAGYIFLNSLAGLAGTEFPADWKFPWAAALVVSAAGLVGSLAGSRIATPPALRRGLGLVLALAALKCIQHVF